MTRSRAWRRWKNFTKARRKWRLDGELTPYFHNNDGKLERYLYYKNLHEYSKGKIHCSCPMCTAKTNAKIHKSRGPVSFSNTSVTHARGSRIPITNHRYGKKSWRPSDRRRIDAMNSDEWED